MIQLYHVYKSFGPDAHALADITTQILKGEFVYLTGPSGAGKSTLLKLIFCALRPTRGQILVGGRNVARLSASAIPFLRRDVGVVFQDFKLLPRRSVADNVGIALEVQGISRLEIRRRTHTVLRQVGLAHRANHRPSRLSGGEQQRVAIARALVGEPHILLADEPTGNLDADRAAEIMDLLARANARGTTIVVATHDRQLIDKGDRRIIALEEGRLVMN